MIHFSKIRWKNFLSTGNSWIEIELDKQPNTLVVGENGSGKSTVLDALTFVLFGKPFRKINKPQLVNTINGSGTLVEIEFNIGKTEYLVRRGIKPTVFDIVVNDEALDQSANARDFQELLERQILKLNYKSFTQVVILGSSTFVPFMQLTAANRRDVIEDLLDIEIFSSMNVILKQRLSEIKDNTRDNGNLIKIADEKIALHGDHVQQLKQDNAKRIHDKKASIKEIKTQNTKLAENASEKLNEIKALESQILDFSRIRQKHTKATGILGTLSKSQGKLFSEIEFYEDHNECPTCEQEIHEEFKSNIIREKCIKKDEIVKAVVALNYDIEEMKTRLGSIENTMTEIQDIEHMVSRLESDRSANDKLITNLNKDIEEFETSTGNIDDASHQLEVAENEKTSLEGDKEILINKKHIHDTAYGLLKDTGIKTRIIKQYIPIMNKLVNKYLASMDFFVNFTLDESFNETIKSRFRDDFSYASFSEGEKMRIDLALLFTWRAVAKMKNSTNTNLLILDEVFDSSLDSSGTDEFMKILWTLGTDQNVFIISHKGDVLQDKFRGFMRFEKVKGFTQISKNRSIDIEE
jgi:DNA repair exonuclease SbcCD ATPase subunit